MGDSGCRKLRYHSALSPTRLFGLELVAAPLCGGPESCIAIKPTEFQCSGLGLMCAGSKIGNRRPNIPRKDVNISIGPNFLGI